MKPQSSVSKRHASDPQRAAFRELLGAWLKDRRDAAGLTQEYLAAEVGCDTNTIQNWEKARVVPVAENFFKCALALGEKDGPSVWAGIHAKSRASVAIRTAANSMPPFDLMALRDLTSGERARLYEEWRALPGMFYAAEHPPLSLPEQRKLQVSLPIDLNPLRTLLVDAGIPGWRFPFPIIPGEYVANYSRENLRQFQTEAFSAISETIRAAGEIAGTEFERKIAAVTEYLSATDPLRARERADIAFVPGYRSHLRAQMAGEVYAQGRVKKIYLSGHGPRSPDGSNPVPALSEALAMAIYLIDQRPDFKIQWEDLIVDPRATSTIESVQLAERRLAGEARLAQRPLTVLIVTSPYHLRRTELMLRRLALKRPNIIGEIRTASSETRAGIGKTEWHRHRDGVAAYLTEYWAIYGGRVAGEF
jgi:transcriptional regulator with XRE-family HTH domain